jgi:hypothetical protein
MAADLTRLRELVETHNDLQKAKWKLDKLALSDRTVHTRAVRGRVIRALDALDNLILDERAVQGI